MSVDFDTSSISYKSVVGSTMAQRTAFDGSVPYCVSCSARLGKVHGDSDVKNAGYFSVIGQPNAGAAISACHDGLVKQCIVNLSDMTFYVSGGYGQYTIRITVCDPTDFPDNDPTHTYLYENVFYCSGTSTSVSRKIEIPDISGIVINGTTAAPLNVCVYVSASGRNDASCDFHCVASVDD